MKFSFCLIARNEESRLGAAISSIRDQGFTGDDVEVIVTDTGSTDGTVQLAKSFGARVSHFEWCNDFAAARNACQSHARGEWVFWLDADERLKAGSGAEIRRLASDPACIAYHVIREDFFAHDRTDWFSEMYQLRLMRRELPCRFVGLIHEHLEPDIAVVARSLGKAVRASGIRIQHWGYTSDRLPDKLRRAAEMCEAELRERPGQFYYLVEWARSLIAIGSPKAPAALALAAEALVKHRHEPTSPSPMAASMLEQLLAMPGQKFIVVDELLELSRRWFPRSAPLRWASAHAYTVRGDWKAAELELRRLLELLETSTHDRFMSFDPRVSEDALFNLGVCLVRQAELAEAKAVFEKLAASPRRAADARKNLDAISELEARFAG